jgi:hypothetical protein
MEIIISLQKRIAFPDIARAQAIGKSQTYNIQNTYLKNYLLSQDLLHFLYPDSIQIL